MEVPRLPESIGPIYTSGGLQSAALAQLRKKIELGAADAIVDQSGSRDLGPINSGCAGYSVTIHESLLTFVTFLAATTYIL